MNGFWLASYLILWLVVVGCGLVLLALGREIEALHRRLDSLDRYLRKETPTEREV